MKGSLLIAGTGSDAGKSVIVAGLCRLLAREGVRVAPFKAQNMSLNSAVTADGAEIGRAQAAQAFAAGIPPEAAMNPVLLKPSDDRRAQVIVMGHAIDETDAEAYLHLKPKLLEIVIDAYDDLRSRFDVVICEGAGSPAEINLRENDLVNMGFARRADIPVVIVGDIDRGGVFASLYGSVALLDPSDQALVRGYIINKFRGDRAILEPGLGMIEDLTGRPVLGDAATQAIDIVTAAWSEPSPEIVIDPLLPSEPEPADVVDEQSAGDVEPTIQSRSFVEPPESFADAVMVSCLGPYRVERAGRVIHKGWRAKAREILAYLVAHPEGAPKDVLIDMLWPELDPLYGWRDFKRTVSKIRGQVRGKDETRKYIVKVGESYRLEEGAWASDVWEFTRLIEKAKTVEPVEERELLSKAISLYRGDFCSDCYFSWAEPFREKYRRTFLRASAKLATLFGDANELDAALEALERAIEVDPLNEELYRRAMTIEAALGRVEEARGRFRKLEAILSQELGVDPSAETQELIRELESMKTRVEKWSVV